MPPLLFARWAWIASLLCSRTSLCLETLALRHQLAVYKQTVARPNILLVEQTGESRSAGVLVGGYAWESLRCPGESIASRPGQDIWNTISGPSRKKIVYTIDYNFICTYIWS
jgi:hypothetical protein